jgi:adenylate cyclase
MTALCLDSIRDCLEGYVPSVITTCDTDGVPNVSLLSQVHYVDPERVALSYQFFNKTRKNVIETRMASVAVFDPVTMARYRLDLEYEETRTSGPLFESMRAKLAGIASHTGMESVFRLLGSDIYRVRGIDAVPADTVAAPVAKRNLLSGVRRTTAELANCRELGDLFDRTLSCLQRYLGIEHAMVLMLDRSAGRLYTVASQGYARSGIGFEVSMGDGVIGAAARERVPIRIGHMSADYSYGVAVRESARLSGVGWTSATEIPYPGLKEPQSQIAVPIVQCGTTIGVLFAESQQPMRFCYDDEDALAILAVQIGAAVALMQVDEPPAELAPPEPVPVEHQRRVTVRHYRADDSIFLDHDYLIKGVAGAIFWKIVREYAAEGRVEFTNRELRLDPALRLPGFTDNLEARLILLHRRLDERNGDIRIEKCGRGRFRLALSCTLALEEISPESNARMAAV